MAEADAQPRNRGRTGGRTRYRRQIAERLPAMFENGESVAEVAQELGVSRMTFYRWVDKHKEFREAYEEGLFRSEAWWLRLGRAGAAGQIRGANATMWIFNMKNRFKWRDLPAEEGGGPGDMTPEEFARRASAALAEMEKRDNGGDGRTTDTGLDAA